MMIIIMLMHMMLMVMMMMITIRWLMLVMMMMMMIMLNMSAYAVDDSDENSAYVRTYPPRMCEIKQNTSYSIDSGSVQGFGQGISNSGKGLSFKNW